MATVRIAGRDFDKDKTVATLLTSAGWLLGQLPDRVRKDQRKALVETLGSAQNLVVEVHTRPAAVLIRDGDLPLLKIPARV